MSTWRIEVKDGKEVKEVEDEGVASLRSRLARNATNFGMAAGASIHLRRRWSERVRWRRLLSRTGLQPVGFRAPDRGLAIAARCDRLEACPTYKPAPLGPR